MALPESLVAGVDFVCVPTSDLGRAVPFYENVLGLRVRKRWGKMPGVEFQAGNLTLALMESEAFGQEFRANSLPIAFRVDDVAAVRERLEAEDVEFSAQFDSGVCIQAVFSDPDGNPLILHHRYAPEEA